MHSFAHAYSTTVTAGSTAISWFPRVAFLHAHAWATVPVYARQVHDQQSRGGRSAGLGRPVFNSPLASLGMAGSSSQAPLPQVVVVTGPTGVGKTAVSLLLAERLGGEVVSADSVQVYRGLDIGSDKLPVAERRGVPHHLLDVCDVTEEYTAGRFHDEARAAIRDILARGRVPIVAGGTGFYLRFLVEGKPATQKASDGEEAAVELALTKAWQQAADAAGLGGLDALTAEARWEAGVALLGAAGDTEAMQRIGEERNNYYRLKRALAILAANPGRTLRELDISVAAAGSMSEFDFRTFFLHRPRAVLYDKVDQRLQEMVLGGLLDEAALLLHQGIEPGSNMASSAVGYRQAMNWLLKAAIELEDSGRIEAGLEELVSAICWATHRLIRTQMTWFRKKEDYKWLDVEALGGAEAVASAVMEDLAKPCHTGAVPPGQGQLAREEQQEFKERRLEPTVLLSRPEDVAAVMAHVTGELVPAILAAPQVRPALVSVRREREEAQAAELSKRHEEEALKQERLARKAAAKEAHIARNKALGQGGGKKKQQRLKEGAGAQGQGILLASQGPTDTGVEPDKHLQGAARQPPQQDADNVGSLFTPGAAVGSAQTDTCLPAVAENRTEEQTA